MSDRTLPKPNGDGSVAIVPSLPVDNFREAAPFLRRPFTEQAVRFKVQVAWSSGALIVAYIDARLVIERLNRVCPDLWFDEYQAIDSKLMMCKLTVDGISRRDVGEGTGKGLYSDALKRAAVKFGIGVSLYAIPKMIADNRDLDRKQTPGKPDQVTLKQSGEVTVRAQYALWLERHGVQAFGDPLDHGDADEAVGDHDAAEVPEGVDPETGEVHEPIDLDRATVIVGSALDAGLDGKLRLAASHVHGSDVGECGTPAEASVAIGQLNPNAALKLERWIADRARPEVQS